MQISRRGGVGGARDARGVLDPAGRRRERRGREVERAEIHEKVRRRTRPRSRRRWRRRRRERSRTGRRWVPNLRAGVRRARGVIRGRVSSPHGTTIGGDASRGTREVPSSPRCRTPPPLDSRARDRLCTLASPRTSPGASGVLSPRACGIGAARSGFVSRLVRAFAPRPPSSPTRTACTSSSRGVSASRPKTPRTTTRRTRDLDSATAETRDDRISRRDFSARAKPSEKTPRCAADDSIAEHIGRSIAARVPRPVVSSRRRRTTRRTGVARFATRRFCGFPRQDWTRWRRRRHARSCRWRGARARVRTPSDRT